MKRNRIRYTAVIAALALTPTIVAPLLNAEEQTAYAAQSQISPSLIDVRGHWAEKEIEKAIEIGYVSGYEDGTFKPDNTIANAEFIKMLVVALNPTTKYTHKSGSDWYQVYVDEAIKQGLILKDEFPKMTDNMKRSDLAKLGVRGIGETNNDEKKWMYLATLKGLINGVDNIGTLNGNGNMTRAEAITVIERILKINSGETLPIDKKAVANAEALYKSKSFIDLSGHWAKDTIDKEIALGYLSGYEDGTFKPDNPVANSEFIKMLVVALNPNANYTAKTGEEWYQPYIDEAIKKGLITNTEFPKMTDNMKRSDLAKLGVRGIGETNNDEKKWMYLATSKGLINGKDNQGKLDENGNMTRAEAVTVISRILKVKAGETLQTDKYAIANAEILWHNTNVFTIAPQWFFPNMIDTFKGKEENLISKSPDGNVVSKVTKLIAIDLDDPNDPNRHYLNGKIIKTGNSGNINLLNAKNGFVFMSLGELTVKDTTKINRYTMPHLVLGTTVVDFYSIQEGQYYSIYSEDPKVYPGQFMFADGNYGKTINHQYFSGKFVSKDFKLRDSNEFIRISFS